MKNFAYKKVSSLEEAFLLLGQFGERARILAGGTDLLVKMRNQELRPEILVDIKGIPGLDEVRRDQEGGLHIGALASIHGLERNLLIREKFRSIYEAAASLGSLQIRNRATLGGNLCNASPAGEMSPSLISLGARARIQRVGGERWVILEDFFTGPGKTVLQPGELLASVWVPSPPPRTGCKYTKYSIRQAMDLAIVGVAVALTLDSQNLLCREVKIALGAVGPRPLRARTAESRLRGQRMDEYSSAEASRLAAEEVHPISDIRASSEYRREMVRVLTQKTLKQAQEALGGWGKNG